MDAELLIRKSITGTITPAEQKQLQQLLVEQPELKEVLGIEYAMYQHRNTALKTQLKNAIPGPEVATKSFGKYWYLLILVILLSTLGYWLFQKDNSIATSQGFADIYLSEKSVSPVRLMNDEIVEESQWSSAIDAYSTSQYDAALGLIKNIANPNSEQKLYEGLCYIYKKQPDYNEANRVMESLQHSSNELVADQALWYGALVDIKLSRVEDAQLQLVLIVQEKLWKNKQAQKLLELLRKGK